MSNQHKHKNRDDLTGEHTLSDAGQAVIALLFTAVWLLDTFFLHFISRHEERLLLARFGEEYARYMREVPMWLPRIRKK
ncbi:hypothetical protein JXO59_14205 [candidate division KSB1 bacterium]|nr:hypothetical protein [candidate division KSB1 bacterium]